MDKKEFEKVCEQIACTLRRSGREEYAAGWEKAGQIVRPAQKLKEDTQ